MGLLESTDLTVFFLGLAVLLATARGMGELARRWGQPSVVGEMLAGVLLGPTCLGTVLRHAGLAVSGSWPGGDRA